MWSGSEHLEGSDPQAGPAGRCVGLGSEVLSRTEAGDGFNVLRVRNMFWMKVKRLEDAEQLKKADF